MDFSDVEKFFFQNPGETVHLRELCRKIDRSPSYVSERLEKLTSSGQVSKEERGNMTIFRADTEEKNYRKRKKIFNLWQLETSGLKEHIAQKLYPETLVLIGSYLKGTDTSSSDIDIVVINGRDTEIDLSDYEEELGRKIHLITLNDTGKIDKEFKDSLSNGYVLSGHLSL